MKVSENLTNKYSNYYDSDQLHVKRKIAAQQTAQHLFSFVDFKVENLLDIGAGEGSLLSELAKIGFAQNFHAVEISSSGINSIEKKQIMNLKSVSKFDGYQIDAHDHEYDFGTAVHVLEHVEHERAFLREISRCCKQIYIEVPLELTLTVRKSIRLSGPYGHINFYNPVTFKNLLETSDLKILKFKVFANSLAYETHISGELRGMIKYLLRSQLLGMMPKTAPHLLSYLAGVLCCRNQ